MEEHLARRTRALPALTFLSTALSIVKAHGAHLEDATLPVEVVGGARRMRSSRKLFMVGQIAILQMEPHSKKHAMKLLAPSIVTGSGHTGANAVHLVALQ